MTKSTNPVTVHRHQNHLQRAYACCFLMPPATEQLHTNHIHDEYEGVPQRHAAVRIFLPSGRHFCKDRPGVQRPLSFRWTTEAGY
jgi:hypothetical protein